MKEQVNVHLSRVECDYSSERSIKYEYIALNGREDGTFLVLTHGLNISCQEQTLLKVLVILNNYC